MGRGCRHHAHKLVSAKTCPAKSAGQWLQDNSHYAKKHARPNPSAQLRLGSSSWGCAAPQPDNPRQQHRQEHAHQQDSYRSSDLC